MSADDPPDLTDFVEILQQLVREPSVVGTEDSLFRVLRRELEEVDVTVERHLGVLVARGRDPESIRFSRAANTSASAPLSLGRTELGRLVAATAGQITNKRDA